MESNIKNPEEMLQKLLSLCPIPVEFDNHVNFGHGFYNPEQKKIVLQSSLDPIFKIKTLLHEMAHYFAFELGEQKITDKEEYRKGEYIAEDSAYICSNFLGLDTENYSFSYIANWVKDPIKILNWGKSMKKVSDKLIESIEPLLV